MGALIKIREAGFNVVLVDGFIDVSPANRLTEKQLTFLKSNKAEIVSELQAENNSAVVSCAKCQHFKSHNQHGRGAGYCLIGGAYGLWSESPHQCTQFDAAVKWVEMPDPKPDALTVICYTPNGKPIKVQARDPEHASYLIRMNPKQEIK